MYSYGKSHILATLAVYLISKNYRVVYISDCYTLIEDSFNVLRKALLTTFIDDDYFKTELLELKSKEELENFCRLVLQGSESPPREPIQLTFIIDQTNAFDQHPDVPASSETLHDKGEARRLLHHCCLSHVLIQGASANNETAKHFRHRQVSAIGETIYLNGGFSQVR